MPDASCGLQRGGAGLHAFLLVLLALTLGEACWNSVLGFLELGDPAGNATVTKVAGLHDSQVGLFATSFFTGELLCSPLLGYLADSYGRRPALIISLSVALIGGTAAIVAPVSSAVVHGGVPGCAPLLLALFVQGCGVGGAIPITEALVVEYFDEEDVRTRGWWACLISLGWPLGSVLSTTIAWVLIPMVHAKSGGHGGGSARNDNSHPSDTSGWQTAFQAQGGLHGWPGCYLILSCINILAIVLLWARLPESSKYLKMKRSQILGALSTTNTPKGLLQDVLSQPKPACTTNQQSQVRPRLTCSQTYTWLLICIIWFAVSFSGNGFAVTLPLFLNNVNNSSSGAIRPAQHPRVFPEIMLWSLVGIPGVFIAGFLVEADSFGRKRVVVLSSFLTGVCFFMFALCHSSLAATLTSSAQNVVVMCCWAGIATLTSELAPTTHRARLLGISNMVKALAGIFGPYVGGLFAQSRPFVPLLVFSGVMCLGSIAGMLLPKDTRGQKLENEWQGAAFAQGDNDLEREKGGRENDEGLGLLAHDMLKGCS